MLSLPWFIKVKSFKSASLAKSSAVFSKPALLTLNFFRVSFFFNSMSGSV